MRASGLLLRAAKRSGGGGGGGRKDWGRLQQMAERLLRPVPPPPKLSAAEQAVAKARMQRYGRFKMRQHRDWQVRAERFMVAKWAALDALPHERRVEAMDTSRSQSPPPPLHRPIWTHTPPIKGFSLSNLTELAEQRRSKARTAGRAEKKDKGKA